MTTKTILKIFLLTLVTVALLEAALRITFTLPDFNVYRYNPAADIILFKPNLNTQINTRRSLNFKKNTQENELPKTVHIVTDENGFRNSVKSSSDESIKHLVLGDSITLGWPIPFENSAVMLAQDLLQQPISSCAFMGMGPVQLYRLIETHNCPVLKNIKSLTIQITLHNTLTFPDTLFIDNLGESFQSKLIFSINNPSEEISFISDEKQSSVIKEFNEHYFNTRLRLVDSTFLTKIFFNLGTSPQSHPFKRLEQLVQDNILENVRHEKTLLAIERIAAKFALKPAILENRTKSAMIHPTPRPEVTALLNALKDKGYLVKDMIDEKNNPGMPSQFYYINDYHPNAQGHRLLAKKLAELINKE